MTPPARFAHHITPLPSGCWQWLGFIDRAGYGQAKWDDRAQPAHRAVYEAVHGTVTTEDLDHLCRNRSCVNPEHLEPVTHRENTRRGNSPMGINARKTECIRGHAFDAENTIRRANGNRDCRACQRVRYELRRDGKRRAA